MSSYKPSKSRKIASRFAAMAVLATLTTQTLLIRPSALQMGMQTPVSFGLPPAAAQGRSQSTNSKVIVLLLASSREENPQKAIVLLQQAREELKKERLAPQDNARILNLIEDLEAKARARQATRNGSNASPSTPATPPATYAPAARSTSTLAAVTGNLPVVADLGSLLGDSNAPTKEGMTTKDVEKSLAANPELRDTLWEIGRSRLSRDTQNLDMIIQDRTGKTPEQIDEEDAKARAEGYKPGVFLDMLAKLNLLNLDVSKANLQLKQEFDGVSLDILADKLISDATRYSIPIGVFQGVVNDLGASGRFVGVSAETLMTFVLNAKLALRLADLYGVEFDDSEKQIVLIVVFSIAKIAGQYGSNSPSMLGMYKNFGDAIAKLKYAASPGKLLEFFKRFVSSPAVTRAVGPEIAQLALFPLPTGQHGPPSPVAPAPATTPGTTAATTAPPHAPAPAGAPANTPPASVVRGQTSRLMKWISSRINFAAILKAGYFGARSATETYAIGHVAKYVFRAAYEEKRRIHNEDFRRFLMTPTAEGFSKLLVLAMTDGRPSYSTQSTARSTAEAKAKVDFIANIARSARTCSAESLAVIKTDRVAQYACAANPSVARFERLRSEMLTYDEIPQDYIADLRTVSREHRLRMAELILQMQFLDGDRSPSETQFFRTVVAKALGVDEMEDLRYFDRLHSFIQERGGLVKSNVTPTGVTVRPDALGNPYDMDRGYSPLNAPQAPPGTRYLDQKSITVAPKTADPAPVVTKTVETTVTKPETATPQTPAATTTTTTVTTPAK